MSTKNASEARVLRPLIVHLHQLVSTPSCQTMPEFGPLSADIAESSFLRKTRLLAL